MVSVSSQIIYGFRRSCATNVLRLLVGSQTNYGFRWSCARLSNKQLTTAPNSGFKRHYHACHVAFGSHLVRVACPNSAQFWHTSIELLMFRTWNKGFRANLQGQNRPCGLLHKDGIRMPISRHHNLGSMYCSYYLNENYYWLTIDLVPVCGCSQLGVHVLLVLPERWFSLPSHRCYSFSEICTSIPVWLGICFSPQCLLKS